MTSSYRSFARKTMLTALVVSLVPLYVLGLVSYVYFSHLQETKLKAELRNLASNRTNAIGLFLNERVAMLEVLAHTSKREELVKSGELTGIFGLLNRRTWSFLDLGLIDASGKHIAYVGPYQLEHKNYASAAWFQHTMQKGVYISDVFLGHRGVPHMVVAVKRVCTERCNEWILRATIDPEVFSNLVRSAQLGQSGDAYILNQEGRYQTPPRFGGKILTKADINLKQVPPGINVVERRSPDGRRLFSAYSWLPKKGWLLVIDQDPKEVLGPMTLGGFGLLLLILGTALIVTVIVLLVRLMVRQLEARDRDRSVLDAQLAHSGRLVSLGRMAAGVAHEINNPLAAIGELAGLMDDLMDEESLKGVAHGQLYKENVLKIQEHVDRARSVTHRLLGFARRMEPHWDLVDVNQVLDEALSFQDKEAMFKNVQLIRQYDQEIPPIKSDRAQLQQVFLNLVENAVGIVDRGGKVTLTTRQTDDGIEVLVSDNGPGIPPEHQDRIMDPFFTTKPQGEGTGLGLSISHSIMHKLGGSLSFNSKPGEGATFVIAIPLEPEAR